MTELEQYIEAQIIPQYDAFDKAHRTDHARMVIARSLLLARKHGADEQMAYTIAAYHDTGLSLDREHHHLTSGEILMADPNLRRWFSDEQRQTMREAVEDHRASSGHAPRSIYGLIVAEADRLIDSETIIRRTIQYGLANYPALDREGHYLRMEEHLKEKYAEGGYLRLWLPDPENMQRLDELRSIMRDQPRLEGLFNDLFDEQTIYRNKSEI